MMRDKAITISACMILKNEAADLPHTLVTLADLGLDEIVIGVDVTSTDETAAMIERFRRLHCGTMRIDVYDVDIKPWSFARARNEGIERATSEWLFVLDGHEVIPARMRSVLRRAIQSHEDARIEKGLERADVLLMKVRCGITGQAICDSVTHPRAWRAAPETRWEHDVHNQLVGHNRIAIKIDEGMFHILHQRSAENDAIRQLQRNEMIPRVMEAELEKAKRSRNKAGIYRSAYYLGNHYMTQGREWARALGYYTLILEAGMPNAHEAVSIIANAGHCLWKLAELEGETHGKENDKAFEAREAARRMWWSGVVRSCRRTECLIELAESLMHNDLPERNLDEALILLRWATQVPLPDNADVALDRRKYSWWPWLRIANIWYEIGAVDVALQAVMNAEQIGYRDPALTRLREVCEQTLAMNPKASIRALAESAAGR